MSKPKEDTQGMNSGSSGGSNITYDMADDATTKTVVTPNTGSNITYEEDMADDATTTTVVTPNNGDKPYVAEELTSPTVTQEQKAAAIETAIAKKEAKNNDNAVLDSMGLKDSYTGETKTEGGVIYAKSTRTGEWEPIGSDRSGKPTASYDDAAGLENYTFAESPSGVRIFNESTGVSENGVLTDNGFLPESFIDLPAAPSSASERTVYDPFKIMMPKTDNYGKLGEFEGWVLPWGTKVVYENAAYEPAVSESGFRLEDWGTYDPKRGVFVVNKPGATSNGAANDELFEVVSEGKHFSKIDPMSDINYWYGTSHNIDELAAHAVGTVNKRTIIDVYNPGTKTSPASVTSVNVDALEKQSAGIMSLYSGLMNVPKSNDTGVQANPGKNSISDNLYGISSWYKKNVYPVLTTRSGLPSLAPEWIVTDAVALPSNTLDFIGLSGEAAKITGDIMIRHDADALGGKRPLSYSDTFNYGASIVGPAMVTGTGILVDQFNTDPARFAYNMGLGIVAGKALGVGAGKIMPRLGLQVRNVGPKTMLETAPEIKTVDLTNVKNPFGIAEAEPIISTVDKNIRVSERINARDIYAESLIENPLTGKSIGGNRGSAGRNGWIDSVGNFIPDKPTIIKTGAPEKISTRIKINDKYANELLENPLTGKSIGGNRGSAGRNVWIDSVGNALANKTSPAAIGFGINGLNGQKKNSEKNDLLLPSFKPDTKQSTKTESIVIPGLTAQQKASQKTIFTQSSKTFTGGKNPSISDYSAFKPPSGKDGGGYEFLKFNGGSGSRGGSGIPRGFYNAHFWKNPGVLSSSIDTMFTGKSKRRGRKKR